MTDLGKVQTATGPKVQWHKDFPMFPTSLCLFIDDVYQGNVEREVDKERLRDKNQAWFWQTSDIHPMGYANGNTKTRDEAKKALLAFLEVV